jgi:hypothetical protein
MHTLILNSVLYPHYPKEDYLNYLKETMRQLIELKEIKLALQAGKPEWIKNNRLLTGKLHRSPQAQFAFELYREGKAWLPILNVNIQDTVETLKELIDIDLIFENDTQP